MNILKWWKFKFSCNIWRTVRSDILNAMTFLFADHRGFLTKAWHTRSIFSGVLSEGSLLGGFLFAADAVSLKFLTHNSRVLRLGTMSFQWVLKCRRNIRWFRTTESLFLIYVSTTKAWCSTDQLSMATEMLWVSLKWRSKTYSPSQQFHSHLCCQIVSYFCRTLYMVRFKEENKLWNFAIRTFHQFSFTFNLLHPNNFLSTTWSTKPTIWSFT